MRQISRRMEMIHPTIGWRQHKHGTHKHAHGVWILCSVSRVRSKTMHSLFCITSLWPYITLCQIDSGTIELGSIRQPPREAARWQLLHIQTNINKRSCCFCKRLRSSYSFLTAVSDSYLSCHQECKMMMQNYRVSQKFVPLNSGTITFDQNFIFIWNCWKMFISLLSTCIQNFSNWHPLFVFLFFKSHSVAVVVDLQMIHFELSPGAQGPVQPPNNICLVWAAGKKYILGIHSKKLIIPASFHSKVVYFSTNLRRAGRYLAD